MNTNENPILNADDLPIYSYIEDDGKSDTVDENVGGMFDDGFSATVENSFRL